MQKRITHMKNSICVAAILLAGVVFANEQETLTVMEWNTEHYGWWDRKPDECQMLESNMFAVVRAVNPDILLVDETYGSFERFRAALPGYDGRLLGACESVYSRYPIVKVYDTYREKTLYGCTYGYDYPKGETGPFHFATVEIDVKGQRIRACPIGMNWIPSAVNFPDDKDAAALVAAEWAPPSNGGSPRAQEIKDILASIQFLLDETDTVPIVIGGDFNSQSHLDWTEATAYHYGHCGRVVPWPVSKIMQEAGFVDTYRAVHPDPVSNYGVTFMRIRPPDPKSPCYGRIDYIYSKGPILEPIASEAFTGAYHRPFTFKGVDYSCFPADHGFVVTTFRLKRGKK